MDEPVFISLYVNDEVREHIRKIIKFAVDNPVKIKAGAVITEAEVNFDQRLFRFPNSDVFVVMLIEDAPTGFQKHLQITVNRKNVTPDPQSTKEIARLFGFKCCCQRHTEIYATENDSIISVNVIEEYKKQLLN
jgi:hypothetical protein